MVFGDMLVYTRWFILYISCFHHHHHHHPPTPHLAPGSKSVYPTSPRGVGGEGNHVGLKRGKEKNGTRRSQSWDEWGVEIGRALVNPRDEDEEEVCDGGVLVNARFVLLEYMSEGGVHIQPTATKRRGDGGEEHPEAREDRKSGRSS